MFQHQAPPGAPLYGINSFAAEVCTRLLCLSRAFHFNFVERKLASTEPRGILFGQGNDPRPWEAVRLTVWVLVSSVDFPWAGSRW